MVDTIAGSVVANNDRSIIIGSSMQFRWENGPSTLDVDAKAAIGDYEVLVLTDVSSSFNTNTFPPTQAALPTECFQWVDRAWNLGNGGAGAETFLWCTWARTDVPDINAQYQRRIQLWSQMQDYANARRPQNQKPVRLIPGSWLWYEFWKDQQNGLTPTSTWYDDLYSDEIHQRGIGEYIAEVLHVCCIYGVDPLNTPASSPSLPVPTPAELAYIRNKIKQVVRAVPRSGVDTSSWL